jgi:hypothetical protein
MPVGRGHGGAAERGTDGDHLAVDIGRATGQEEPQCRVGVDLLALEDGDQVGRGAGTQLLADRADHALNRAPGGPQHRVRSSRRHRASEHDDPSTRRQLLQGRPHDGPERVEVGQLLRPRQVQDDRADPLPLRNDGDDVDRLAAQHGGGASRERCLTHSRDENRTGHKGLAGRIPAQSDRPRQP